MRNLKLIPIFVLLILLSSISTKVEASGGGDTFNCTTDLFIVLAGDLYTLNTDQTPYELDLIGTSGNNLNGIAYNHTDNYIYGMNANTGDVLRVSNSGAVTNIGTPTGALGWPGGSGWVRGTMIGNGNYVVSNGSELFQLDVSTTPPTIISRETLDASNFADFATSPITDVIYGYNSTSQTVSTITLSGTVTNLPEVNGANSVGSAFFDSFGTLYFYGQDAGSSAQDTFFIADIDPASSSYGQVTAVSSGPEVTQSDGTSCAFGIDMFKTVSPSTVTAGDTVTYTYSISNLSGTGQNSIDFSDTLPSGLTYVNNTLSNPYGGTSNSYGGTNTLTINGMTISTGSGSISVDVLVPASATAGTVYNQATLSSLPTEFGSTIQSEYPPTPVRPDPTPLEILAAGTTPTPTQLPQTALFGDEKIDLFIIGTILSISGILMIRYKTFEKIFNSIEDYRNKNFFRGGSIE